MKPVRIYFIDYSQDPRQKHPQHFFSPAEIGYCFSILEKLGCQLSLLDLRVNRLSFDKIIKILKQNQPDILLLKPIAATKDIILKIADSLKDKVQYIYCYGPTATLWPGMFLYPDSPITGCFMKEIEYTVLDLAKCVAGNLDIKSLKGAAYFDKDKNAVSYNKRELITDLDSLPLPKHSIFVGRGYSFGYPVRIYRKMKVAYVLSSRGCPETCTFCSVLRRSSYGKAYRARTAGNIIAELKYIISLGFNTVYFMDDNFSYDKQRVKDICNEIIKNGIQNKIKWVVQCSIKSLDGEIIQIMKTAGCSTVCLGIESANKNTLVILEKYIDQQDILEVVKKLKKAKIMIVAFFIIGSPFETTDDILKTIEFCKKICPDMLQVHYCSAYPDAPLFKANYSLKFTTPYECDFISNYSLIKENALKRLYNYFYRSYYLDFMTILNFFRKQSITYLINWREKVPFCIKSIAYIYRR